MKHDERAEKSGTKQRAKSTRVVTGLASKRSGAPKRPLAVFDIDGTLVRWQLYHAIADEMVKLGYVKANTYDSVKAARAAWKRREPDTNFKTYEAALISVYEKALRNVTTAQLETAVQAVFDKYKDQVYTYTRNLITKLKAEGYLIFAISGSQSEIVELMAVHYGFDDFVGTVYERSGERFTGASVVGSHDKSKALKELAARHSVNFAGSIAVGDSKSDAAMLELVEQPIAFNPDKELFEIAAREGWKVVLERKNMVYELEQRNGRYELAKAN